MILTHLVQFSFLGGASDYVAPTNGTFAGYHTLGVFAHLSGFSDSGVDPSPDEATGSSQDYTRRRRKNERFTTVDELIQAQEELTAFKALTDLGQKIVAAKAIKEVEASVSTAQPVLDAKEALEEYNSASEALLHLDELNILLTGYFVLKLRQREDDDIAAMLMLGII